MKELILFLLRKKLGVRFYEYFQFDNQKSGACYYFTEDGVMKRNENNSIQRSSVSLNWLLDSRCKVHKVGGDGAWV